GSSISLQGLLARTPASFPAQSTPSGSMALFRPFALLALSCLVSAVVGDGDAAHPCNDGVCHAEEENAALLQSTLAPTKVKVQLPEELVQKVDDARHKTHIKIRRATVRKSNSVSDVWDQMSGAVKIDELKEKLKTAAKDYAKQKLQEEIDKLEKAYPAAFEIKDKFQSQWDQIVSGVNLDELKQEVKECSDDVTKCAKDKLPKLQSQLEEALKGTNLEGIKTQAEEYWNKIQLELPDMDDLKEALGEYGGQAKEAWDEFMQTNDFSSLTDAAQSIANDAWGKVSGAVGGWFR
ncbi:unnamed protein product, partial [Prorocentrum cordatum]